MQIKNHKRENLKLSHENWLDVLCLSLCVNVYPVRLVKYVQKRDGRFNLYKSQFNYIYIFEAIH